MTQQHAALKRRTVLQATAASIPIALLGQKVTVPARAQTGSWPRLGYDAGMSFATSVASAPTAPIIESQVVADVTTTPAIADGVLYVEHNEQMRAIDRSTGTEQWTVGVEGGSNVPTLGEENLYCLYGEGGRLLAVDRDSGDLVWEHQLEGTGIVEPTIRNGLLSLGWNLTALGFDPDDGDLIWETHFDTPIIGGTTADDSQIYAATIETVAALDPTDGSPVWEHTLSDEPDPMQTISPATRDGRVYSGVTSLTARDTTDGSELWRFDTAEVGTQPVLTEEFVYIGIDDDTNPTTVAALDTANGEVEWEYSLPDPITDTPAFAGGTVFVPAGSSLYALAGGSGSEEWTHSVGKDPGTPLIVDGEIYLSTAENGIVVLKEETETTGDPNDTNGDDGTEEPTDDTPEDEGEADQPADDDDGFGPGFGAMSALAGLGGAGYLLAKRLQATADDNVE